MFAVVFDLTKIHQCTYGRPLTVVTDHKPLVVIAISKKPLSKFPKCLQSLLLCTQVYNFELIYCPSKELHLSDALSHAPLSDTVPEDKLFVNNCQYTPFSADRLSQIRSAIKADET